MTSLNGLRYCLLAFSSLLFAAASGCSTDLDFEGPEWKYEGDPGGTWLQIRECSTDGDCERGECCAGMLGLKFCRSLASSIDAWACETENDGQQQLACRCAPRGGDICPSIIPGPSCAPLGTANQRCALTCRGGMPLCTCVEPLDDALPAPELPGRPVAACPPCNTYPCPEVEAICADGG